VVSKRHHWSGGVGTVEKAGKTMRHLRILNYVDEVARSRSIRGAAARMNVTASAVNRRIADLEEELGAQLFERRPRGVRLTAAGEVFLHYLRGQNGEVERMKSQIEDLKGLRRGTVRIACSQALALVSFDLKVADREWAMAALAAYEVELVMVFRPPFLANFQPLMTLEQQLVVVMAGNHPLAGQRKLRLSDCAAYPVALPERSIGGRQLLEEFSARTGLRFKVAAESNSFEMLRALVVHAGLISFQIQIGTMAAGNKLGVVAREIDGRDVPRANLVFGHLRERALPVATAVFAETIRRKLEAMRAAGATSDVRKPARAASRRAS